MLRERYSKTRYLFMRKIHEKSTFLNVGKCNANLIYNVSILQNIYRPFCSHSNEHITQTPIKQLVFRDFPAINF